MKLCKDCKYHDGNRYDPRCSHPEAERSVVDGSLMTGCAAARGTWVFGPTNKSVCWPDAKLFEETLKKEPSVENLEAAAKMVALYQPIKKQSWIERILGMLGLL